MKVIYSPQYNIDLGPLNLLHPFDGRKFRRVFEATRHLKTVECLAPGGPISSEMIEEFVGELLKRLIRGKRYILQALEIPYLPLLPFSLFDHRILLPMRWGVAGTMLAAEIALKERLCWNLAGGYHHASRDAAEGFCIYNDIGIAYDQLLKRGIFEADDKVLIVDVDAHHGNGNAHVFMENPRVTLLDMFNDDIYPSSYYTKERVDVPVRLRSGVQGEEYLSKLDLALSQLESHYRLAFVIAGTDVLRTDPLGRMQLTVDECTERDARVASALRRLSVPTVVVGGGGYGPESAAAIVASISKLADTPTLFGGFG